MTPHSPMDALRGNQDKRPGGIEEGLRPDGEVIIRVSIALGRTVRTRIPDRSGTSP